MVSRLDGRLNARKSKTWKSLTLRLSLPRAGHSRTLLPSQPLGAVQGMLETSGCGLFLPLRKWRSWGRAAPPESRWAGFWALCLPAETGSSWTSRAVPWFLGLVCVLWTAGHVFPRQAGCVFFLNHDYFFTAVATSGSVWLRLMLGVGCKTWAVKIQGPKRCPMPSSAE